TRERIEGVGAAAAGHPDSESAAPTRRSHPCRREWREVAGEGSAGKATAEHDGTTDERGANECLAVQPPQLHSVRFLTSFCTHTSNLRSACLLARRARAVGTGGRVMCFRPWVPFG